MTVWTSPGRAGVAGELLDVMGSSIELRGIGGPRSTEVDQLGKRLNCPAGDDLRKLLIDRPADFVLLTTWQGVTPADLRAALAGGAGGAGGARLLSLEPWAAELDDLQASVASVLHSGLRMVPAFLAAPGFQAAADPQEHLEAPLFLRLTSFGPAVHGSLLARALDGWLTLLSFAPLPETISASITGPATAARQITGHLSCHARTADGGSMLLDASDAAPISKRSLSVLGPSGHLQVGDAAYRLVDAEGQVRDASPVREVMPSFADLVADQWRRQMQRASPGPSPGRLAAALACVHACMLSARTRQPESPAKLRDLPR